MVRRNERRSGASSPELRKAGECLKLNFNNDAPQSKLMTRKDSEKDAERPHYYSQFWLDVAAGRRVIGAPKLDEATEVAEPETPEPITLRRPGRNMAAVSDGHVDTHAYAVAEPPVEEDIELEPEPDVFELANEVDDLDIPNILVDETLDEAVEDADLADVDADLMPTEEE